MSKPLVYLDKSTDIVNDKIAGKDTENAYIYLYDIEEWRLIGTGGILSETPKPDISEEVPGVIISETLSNNTLIQGNMTLNGNVQQLPDITCKSITIQNEPNNTNNIYIGRSNQVSSDAHMYTLMPASSATFTISNANLLYVIGTSGDKICYGGEV